MIHKTWGDAEKTRGSGLRQANFSSVLLEGDLHLLRRVEQVEKNCKGVDSRG